MANNLNRLAMQRQVPKRPHKPSSQRLGARIGRIDEHNMEFHLRKMKEWEGTNVAGPNNRSRWWYHRNMYHKVSGQPNLVLD